MPSGRTRTLGVGTGSGSFLAPWPNCFLIEHHVSTRFEKVLKAPRVAKGRQ